MNCTAADKLFSFAVCAEMLQAEQLEFSQITSGVELCALLVWEAGGWGNELELL
jgi:hypothetical protein